MLRYSRLWCDLLLLVALISIILPCNVFATVIDPLPAYSPAGMSEKRDTSTLLALKDKYHLPALAITEGQPDIFQMEVVGIRKESSPIKVAKNDIWHLGSNTKAMTATLIAMLVQEGKVSWTTTLAEVLLSFNIVQNHRTVTIEQLTSHRSGLGDGWFEDKEFTLSLYNLSPEAGRRAIAKWILSRRGSHQQNGYFYANTNYVILGLIIDLVTNRAAEDVFEAQLWGPLKITSAGWGPVPEHSSTSVDNPWPHTPSTSGGFPQPLTFPRKYTDNPPALNTAGRAHMNPTDYNKWLQVQLKGAVSPSAASVLNLSDSSWQKLHTSYPKLIIESGVSFGYTYGGWIRVNYTGSGTQYTLKHDGSNTYNYVAAVLDMKANAAYAAFSNVGGTNASLGTNIAINDMRTGGIIFD